MQTDHVLDEILVADPADMSESKKIGFPVYSSEELTKAQKIAWCKAWRNDLESSGFSAMLRNEEPYELAKLAARVIWDVRLDTYRYMHDTSRYNDANTY